MVDSHLLIDYALEGNVPKLEVRVAVANDISFKYAHTSSDFEIHTPGVWGGLGLSGGGEGDCGAFFPHTPRKCSHCSYLIYSTPSISRNVNLPPTHSEILKKNTDTSSSIKYIPLHKVLTLVRGRHW